MQFSGPFRYYSIFVLLFVTIRRFGLNYTFSVGWIISTMNRIRGKTAHFLLQITTGPT